MALYLAIALYCSFSLDGLFISLTHLEIFSFAFFSALSLICDCTTNFLPFGLTLSLKPKNSEYLCFRFVILDFSSLGPLSRFRTVILRKFLSVTLQLAAQTAAYDNTEFHMQTAINSRSSCGYAWCCRTCQCTQIPAYAHALCHGS